MNAEKYRVADITKQSGAIGLPRFWVFTGRAWIAVGAVKELDAATFERLFPAAPRYRLLPPEATVTPIREDPHA